MLAPVRVSEEVDGRAGDIERHKVGDTEGVRETAGKGDRGGIDKEVARLREAELVQGDRWRSAALIQRREGADGHGDAQQVVAGVGIRVEGKLQRRRVGGGVATDVEKTGNQEVETGGDQRAEPAVEKVDGAFEIKCRGVEQALVRLLGEDRGTGGGKEQVRPIEAIRRVLKINVDIELEQHIGQGENDGRLADGEERNRRRTGEGEEIGIEADLDLDEHVFVEEAGDPRRG